MSKLPVIFVDKVVPLDDYLRKIDCDLFFFYLSGYIGLIEVSLDNPEEPKIPVQVDWFLAVKKNYG